jgi:translation initiation factor 3 subunit K
VLTLALVSFAPQNVPLQDGEADPVPSLLPYLTQLDMLLRTCRFPTFWSTYLSPELAPLRENFTIEVAGFDDAVRQVVIRAVKATFTSIGRERLGSYLNLKGK